MQETDLGIRNKKDAGATASVNAAGAREVSPPRGKLATKIYVDQKTEWSAIKPSGGIPKSDLSTEVQTSLGKADSAVQPSELPTPVAPSSDDSAAGKPADARATGKSLDGKRGKDDIAVYTMSDWYDGSSGQTVAFRYDEASGEWIGEPGIIYAEGHRLRYNVAEGEWQYVLSSGYVIGLSTDEGAMELRPADHVVSRPSVYVATSNTLALHPVFGAVNDGVDPSAASLVITLVPGKCVRLAPTSSALTSIDLAMPPGSTTSVRECRLELDLSALPSAYARLPSITVYSDEYGTVISPPGRTIESVFFCPPGWKYYFTFHEVGPNVWMCERTGSTAPFDDRVEWIGNPGAAYCGTDLFPEYLRGLSMSIEATIQFENWTPRSYFTNWPVFCGSFDNLDVENRFHLIGFWGRSLRWQFGTSGNIDNISYASVDYGEKFTVRQSIDTGAHSASGLMTCRRYTGQGTVNLATSSPPYTSTPPTAELYLFADHIKTASDDYAQDFFIGKCFGQVEITFDTDKRIFVPVVAGGGRGAFYDVFNRQVRYSEGACEFDAGPVA